MSTIDFRPTTGSSNAATVTEFTSTLTETAAPKKMATCSECGAEYEAGADSCPSCGVAFATVIVVDEEEHAAGVSCPECSAVNDADAKMCDQCGSSMEMEEVEEASLPPWEGELAFEGMPSSDGRILLAGEITNRDLPLTLMFQYITADGHMGAEACGKITHIWREPRPEMGASVVAVMGSGEFSNDMMGPTAAASVEEEIVRHVSVDIAPMKRVVVSAQTLQEIGEEEFDLEAYKNGDYLLGIGGEIMGATIVPFSAFADAQLRVVREGEESVIASGQLRIVSTPEAIVASAIGSFKIVPHTITAAAAKMAPIAPPKDWFFTPEPDGKFPLTVMDDGRIMGHLATWDQCHHGFMNECVLAKGSRADYKFFHVGTLKTKEGDYVEVGRIVVGETAAAGHASVQYSAAEASKHYDKAALVGAFVRAVDGKYGIWLSGVVRSDCPAERVRDMLANPPSGDWRREGGWLELIAALSVPVPGFPVPRYEYALTASAEDVEVQTLIATGYYEVEGPSYSRAEQRRRDILISKAREIVAPRDEGDDD